MYSAEALKITGYHDELVPNTFLKQEDEANHIGIVLPGIAYTCQMPLLYYTVRLLLSLDADVLQVEYAYNQRSDFRALPSSEREHWLVTDATSACRCALTQRNYKQVTIVGKSIATIAMGNLLTTEATLANAQAIWLTPLLRNEKVRSQSQQCRQRSLFVIGTADPHYEPTYLSETQAATKGKTVVIDGADHSLEIGGDILQSLNALEQIVRAIQAFLQE